MVNRIQIPFYLRAIFESLRVAILGEDYSVDESSPVVRDSKIAEDIVYEYEMMKTERNIFMIVSAILSIILFAVLVII